MAIKISAHKKETEPQPSEPIVAPVTEEPEQPVGWVPPVNEETIEPPVYTGEKAPPLLRFWMIYMIFSFVITAIGSFGVGETFSESLLLFSLPFLCYAVPVILALLRLGIVRYVFAGMITAVIWNAITNEDFSSISSFFGISLVFFALYIFFSKKVRIYLSYKKSAADGQPKNKYKILSFVFIPVAIFSFLFAILQVQSNVSLQSQVSQLEEQYQSALKQKSAVIDNATSLQKEVSALKIEINKLQDQNAKLQEAGTDWLLDLAWYENNIALINNYHGNCAYHTASCHHLGQTFYVTTIHGAKSQGCWSCSDCH